MRLIDLEPQFYRYELGIAGEHHGRPMPDGTTQWGGFPVDTFCDVDDLSQADGISFLCPLCFERNGGNVGTHGIRIDFVGRGTPDSACIKNSQGVPVRWTVQGTSYEDLTLGPSILIIGGCAWHGFVEQGGIRTC
jgi:hypothetical protein